MQQQQQDWIISDSTVDSLVPASGWLRRYIDYARMMTDAPLIYHYGVAMTILGVAASDCDVRVDTQVEDRVVTIPTPFWSVLIGISGDRKSESMELGVRLIQRARRLVESEEKQRCLMPFDGSLEAWTDCLSKSPNSLLYREELSWLITQSKRSYTEGMKEWLLSLHTGRHYDRQTKAGGYVPIERPRLSILSAVPPDTFRLRVSEADWRSGFLARFTFWPGTRERCTPKGGQSLEAEDELAGWLHKVGCSSRGSIHMSPEGAEAIYAWHMKDVEAHRGTLPDAYYSHLLRYEALSYKLAAMLTFSNQNKPQLTQTGAILVDDYAIELALGMAKALQKSTAPLFRTSVLSNEAMGENEVLLALAGTSLDRPINIGEIQRRIPSISMGRLRPMLEVLISTDKIGRIKMKTEQVGRPKYGYYLP